jgi:hypothetical protein
MKRFMIATALTLAAASSALASGTAMDLPTTTQVEIRALVPNAELSNLSVAQVARFNDLFSNSDLRRAGENPAGQVRAILALNN